MLRRIYSLLYPISVGVFPNLASAFPTLREACEKSGTPERMVETLLEQVRDAEPPNATPPHFEVTRVHVFCPPPLEETDYSLMVLFRGTPFTNVEEQLAGDSQELYFSSSFRVALPYGQMQEPHGNYRVILGRVARFPGCQLFDKTVASEDKLRLLDSVHGDIRLLGDATAELDPEENRSREPIFDGWVDWIDDGVSYCFTPNLVQIHTLLCIDGRFQG